MKDKKRKKKARKNKTGNGSHSLEMINAIIRQVWEIIEPICETEGFELVHVEYGSEAGGKILRIYIDKPGGVSLDNCAAISRQAGDILDVLLENASAYNLEVSSPGIDRPLGRIKDFDKFKGKTARMKLLKSINGQKNFKGILAGVSEENIRLLINDRTVAIPFSQISKAHLVSNGEK